MVTQELLNNLFYYFDGSLYWKTDRNYRAKENDKAGWLSSSHRYKSVRIKNKDFKEHRAIFLIHYGYLPQYIDHIDGNPLNNKIENLREATCSQNQYNAKLRKDSSSGIKNVRWHKPTKKWSVVIRINKKETYFGIYDDIELAELVAIEARNKFHKEFARHK